MFLEVPIDRHTFLFGTLNDKNVKYERHVGVSKLDPTLHDVLAQWPQPANLVIRLSIRSLLVDYFFGLY